MSEPTYNVKCFSLPTKNGSEVAMGLREGSYVIFFTSPDNSDDKGRSHTWVDDGKIRMQINLSPEALDALFILRDIINDSAQSGDSE